MANKTHSTITGAGVGLVAGLAGAWVMTKFQSGMKSSGQRPKRHDEPANVKAAAKLANSTLDRDLTPAEKQTGGKLLHYAVGGLSGAVYGALAPVVPLPHLAHGAIFGTAVWAIADELAVAALGLAKPPSEYPVSTHARALAAHLVYGISTALVCRELLEVMEAHPATIQRAAVRGAVSGLRSMTGPFFTVFRGRRFPVATRLLGLLAFGELIADKLPKAPARIKPVPLLGRAIAGGISGAAVFHTDDADPIAGAVIGAAAAVGASYAGYHLRHAAVEKGIPDFAYALGEDALAVSLARSGRSSAG